MQTLSGSESAGRIMGKQWRYLQRYPSVDAISAVEDGSEQIRGPPEVLKGQLKKQLLSGLTVTKPFADRSIVRAAILDRVVEDRRIRSEPGYRKLIDIALECPAIDEVARNVVQPQALTQVVKQLSCSHFV